MADYELYCLSHWVGTAPRRAAILNAYPHPQIDSIEDCTGQLIDRIPPNPNLAVWYIQCRAAVANAINGDANYAILAGRQVWDNWFRLENGTYTGVDEGSPAPEGGVSVSLDDVPWKLTKAMRTALYTWLRTKGLTVVQAHALVQDQLAGELDAKEIVTLARAWLKARPHA